MNIGTSIIVRAALILLLAATVNYQSPAFAQGTAFTYQGRLNDGANTANGVYDLQFAIYDASTNGNQIGNALTNSGTVVTNGLFTVVMDFGNIFTGGSNWLDIAVRTNGGLSFTTLSPRQQLTAAPYAMFANTASNLNGTLAASQLTGTVAIDRLPSTIALVNSNLNFTGTNTFSTNVGIGTNNPQALLQVIGTTPVGSPNNEGVINAIQTGGNFYGGAVYGLSLVPGGSGVIGRADVSGPGAFPAGVWGRTVSTNGVGVYAGAEGSTGTNYGVYAYTFSSSGYAGYFTGGRSFFSGNVGIGTNNPQALLQLVGTTPAASPNNEGVIHSIQTGGNINAGAVYGLSMVPGGSGVIGRDDVSGPPGSFPAGVWGRTLSTNGAAVFATAEGSTATNYAIYGYTLSPVGYAGYFIGGRSYFSGNVGIGTAEPKAPLHVQGDIIGNGKVLMGNGGTNYAASSTENLRIVRGSINGDGSIARGSGFTAVHNGPIGTGSFTITFTPAFSGVPTVTATAVNVIARAGGSITASFVTVSTVSFGGAAVDDSFSFIAVGPY